MNSNNPSNLLCHQECTNALCDQILKILYSIKRNAIYRANFGCMWLPYMFKALVRIYKVFYPNAPEYEVDHGNAMWCLDAIHSAVRKVRNQPSETFVPAIPKLKRALYFAEAIDKVSII